MITQKRLKKLLEYNADTGDFRWLVSTSNRAPIGTLVRGKCRGGYLRARIDDRLYYCHRLVWLYVHGRWPTEHIDHINRDPSDNRLSNLREASNSENMQNRRGPTKRNLTGVLGVGPLPNGKFKAQIVVNGKNRHLGCFETVEEASAAYLAAKQKHHPFAERRVAKRGVQDATMEALSYKEAA